MRRGLAVTAVSLAAAAVAGGAVWAGFALASGKTASATAAASSTSATTPPSSPGAATPTGAAPSSPVALASTAGPSPTQAAVCDIANLQFTNPSTAIAGAEGETVAIVFRNIGSQPCSLRGWPTISTPGLHTKVQYSTFTGAGFEVAVTRVVLQPGEAGATALDIFSSPDSAYGPQCFAAGSWAVTLPGNPQATPVPWPKYQGACPGGAIYVSPVYRGNEPEIGNDSAGPSSIPLLGPFDSPPAMP